MLWPKKDHAFRNDRLREWKQGVVISAVVTIALLLVAEFVVMPILYRSCGVPDRALALLGLMAPPTSSVDDTTINAQGFTGSVLPGADAGKEESFTILTLGGSSIFNHRMTERLMESLSQVSPAKVRIVGAALRTHTSRASVIKYRYYFRKWKFDYVLIYEGINDLWANMVPSEKYEEDYSHLLHWYKRNALLDHSVLARYIYNSFLWSKAPSLVPEKITYRSIHSVERNIRELIGMIRSDGGVPILLTFAWHIPGDYSFEKFEADQLDYVNPSHYDASPVELWGPPDVVRKGLIMHNNAVRKIAQEERILLIDQESIFANHPRLFSDVCHFNEAGTDYFIANIQSFFMSHHLLDIGRK